MKKVLNLMVLMSILSMVSVAKEEDRKENKEEKEKDIYRMFSLEGAYAYNSLINKNGANVKFYFWVNKTYNFGPEFYFYFPTNNSKSPDYQLDFNFRKILVNFHPITFDVLLGPGFRNFKNDQGDRVWGFDGINIGFGMAYRIKNISLFIMPKINHLDPSLQLSSGVKYHFNIERALKFNNRYKLRKS